MDMQLPPGGPVAGVKSFCRFLNITLGLFLVVFGVYCIVILVINDLDNLNNYQYNNLRPNPNYNDLGPAKSAEMKKLFQVVAVHNEYYGLFQGDPEDFRAKLEQQGFPRSEFYTCILVANTCRVSQADLNRPNTVYLEYDPAAIPEVANTCWEMYTPQCLKEVMAKNKNKKFRNVVVVNSRTTPGVQFTSRVRGHFLHRDTVKGLGAFYLMPLHGRRLSCFRDMEGTFSDIGSSFNALFALVVILAVLTAVYIIEFCKPNPPERNNEFVFAMAKIFWAVVITVSAFGAVAPLNHCSFQDVHSFYLDIPRYDDKYAVVIRSENFMHVAAEALKSMNYVMNNNKYPYECEMDMKLVVQEYSKRTKKAKRH